ncbi:hypothetical protein C8J57DRAFT_1624924 [Mycena rebaudengoi]|nr:hypothetical protein C8J57DRAFT_1624924 [Mycena rebaudengoi]
MELQHALHDPTHCCGIFGPCTCRGVLLFRQQRLCLRSSAGFHCKRYLPWLNLISRRTHQGYAAEPRVLVRYTDDHVYSSTHPPILLQPNPLSGLSRTGIASLEDARAPAQAFPAFLAQPLHAAALNRPDMSRHPRGQHSARFALRINTSTTTGCPRSLSPLHAAHTPEDARERAPHSPIRALPPTPLHVLSLNPHAHGMPASLARKPRPTPEIPRSMSSSRQKTKTPRTSKSVHLHKLSGCGRSTNSTSAAVLGSRTNTSISTNTTPSLHHHARSLRKLHCLRLLGVIISDPTGAYSVSALHTHLNTLNGGRIQNQRVSSTS